MNKKLQISKLRKLAGTNNDLFDFQAEVDGRLTYEENRRKVISKLKRRGLLTPKKETKAKFKAGDLMIKALDLHKKRSPRSRAIDASQSALKVFDSKTLTKKQFMKWKKNPSQYDIEGVDTKGFGRIIAQKKGKKMSIKEIEDLLDDF